MFQPCIRLDAQEEEEEEYSSDEDEMHNNDDNDDDKNNDQSHDVHHYKSDAHRSNDEVPNKKSRQTSSLTSSSSSSSPPLPSNHSHLESKSKLTTPFDAALMAVERLIHHKVHTVATSKLNKRDGVGVILYGTPIRAQEQEDHNIHIQLNEYGDPILDDHMNQSGDGDSDDDEDMEDVERPHANASIQTLIELSPPGVDQIKSIRSCLLPEYYDKNYKKKRKKDEQKQRQQKQQKQQNQLQLQVSSQSSMNLFSQGMNNDTIGTLRERDLQIELFGLAGNIQIKEEEEGVEYQGDETTHTFKEEDEGKGTQKETGDQHNMDYSTLRPALHEANRSFGDAT
jgi:hypothetical protein